MAAQKTATDKGFGDERYRTLITLLVAARQRLGLSQLALGEKLGRHQQFVSRYELGERRLDAVEFVDVARSLELDAAKLISDIS